MAALAAAERYRAEQSRYALIAGRQAGRAWDAVPLATLDSWNPLRFARLIAALQLAIARRADGYVAAALLEQGIDPHSEGMLNPAALSAIAGDGRSLVDLFDQPRIQAKTAIGEGTPADVAWQSARSTLRMMAVTAVQDASRLSAGVARVARPQAGGWVRMLTPPSCSRCAILAGKWYRWNAAFDRHPSCDCSEVPANEDTAGDLRTDPAAAVRNGQVTGMSIAERKAFDEGADLSQLVNVHRRGAMYTAAGRRFTREGVTRYGAARLTPEQIYLEAGDDRPEAIRLLRRFGYLT